MKLPESKITKSQTRQFCKTIRYGGQPHNLTATVRYDDQCGNGHNTFSFTGELHNPRLKYDTCVMGGCIYELIAKYFKELEPLIKWHLCGSDGPMHYVGNTLYQAGDRDCWGLRKGEFNQAVSSRTGLPLWSLQLVHEVVPDTCIGAAEKPADVVLKWHPVNVGGKDLGEGKDRNFDAARISAIWPEATDEQLSLEPAELTELLLARLPALMEQFKRDVESLGFTY